jgi:hypothetical protein
MKKLFVVLVMLAAMNASAIDTITGKYFPLQVGNVYKYYFGTSGGYSYTYKIRIVKDTIVENKRYFKFTPFQFEPYSSSLIRFDTLTGNIYVRSANGYCSYSPFEILHDSLKANLNDSATVCNSIYKHRCNIIGYWNILGNNVLTKRFMRNQYSGNYIEYVYAMGFGIAGVNSKEGQNYSSHSLIGCYVNGILYGDTLLTGINQISSEVPSSYSLSQNYPNPFNPTTKIKFDVTNSTPLTPLQRGTVLLKVYDVAGRELQTLVNEVLQPGSYEVTFDGTALNSGVYFYQLTAGSYKETRKMILIK